MAVEMVFTARIIAYTCGGYTVLTVADDGEQDPLYSCESLRQAVSFLGDLTHRSLQAIEEQQTAPTTGVVMPKVLGDKASTVIRPKTAFWRKIVGA